MHAHGGGGRISSSFQDPDQSVRHYLLNPLVNYHNDGGIFSESKTDDFRTAFLIPRITYLLVKTFYLVDLRTNGYTLFLPSFGVEMTTCLLPLSRWYRSEMRIIPLVVIDTSIMSTRITTSSLPRCLAELQLMRLLIIMPNSLLLLGVDGARWLSICSQFTMLNFIVVTEKNHPI